MVFKIDIRRVRAFQKTVKEYYFTHQRVLPWRETYDPYKIWVSEVMLQQTQVDRVLPKYAAFLKAFPTVEVLAAARLQEVLALWVGLGYNRRAQNLHKAAKLIVHKMGGAFPQSIAELKTLPGIGPYTACAVATFAYEHHHTFIETNIRTVYIHHFFAERENIDDKEIMELIETTLPMRNIREWYWGLMDYGTYLKKEVGNASRKSKHHSTQSTFKGSVREARGAIVRILSAGELSKRELKQRVVKSGALATQFTPALQGLLKDKMVLCTGQNCRLQE